MWLGKIPGHSGTQFKHQQAFKNAKDFQNELIKTNGIPISSRSNFFNTDSLKNKIILALIGLFLILLMSIFLYFKKTVDLTSIINAGFSTTEESRYQRLLNEATYHLNNQNIEEAYDEYINLSIQCPDEIEPRIGIYLCSSLLCNNRKLDCDIMENHREFLKSRGLEFNGDGYFNDEFRYYLHYLNPKYGMDFYNIR